MSRLREWASHPPGTLWLIIRAAILLAVVRCALGSLPFPVTRRFLRWLSHPSRGLKGHPKSPHSLARAVSVASRAVPGAAHCLTQALVTWALLARRGQPAELCFGVERESSREFMAHAWVESNGEVIMGGPNIDRYIRLKSPANSPECHPLCTVNPNWLNRLPR